MNARLLLLFALTLVVQGVHADWQTRSWSRWDIGAQGAEAVIGIDRIELERLGLVDDQASLGKQVDRSIAFLSAGVACPVTAVEPQAAPSTLLMLRVAFRCSAPLQSPQIRVRLLFGSTGQPLHYASVLRASVRSDALLTRGADTFDIADAAPLRRVTPQGLHAAAPTVDHRKWPTARFADATSPMRCSRPSPGGRGDNVRLGKPRTRSFQ